MAPPQVYKCEKCNTYCISKEALERHHKVRPDHRPKKLPQDKSSDNKKKPDSEVSSGKSAATKEAPKEAPKKTSRKDEQKTSDSPKVVSSNLAKKTKEASSTSVKRESTSGVAPSGKTPLKKGDGSDAAPKVTPKETKVSSSKKTDVTPKVITPKEPDVSNKKEVKEIEKSVEDDKVLIPTVSAASTPSKVETQSVKDSSDSLEKDKASKGEEKTSIVISTPTNEVKTPSQNTGKSSANKNKTKPKNLVPLIMTENVCEAESVEIQPSDNAKKELNDSIVKPEVKADASDTPPTVSPVPEKVDSEEIPKVEQSPPTICKPAVGEETKDIDESIKAKTEVKPDENIAENAEEKESPVIKKDESKEASPLKQPDKVAELQEESEHAKEISSQATEEETAEPTEKPLVVVASKDDSADNVVEMVDEAESSVTLEKHEAGSNSETNVVENDKIATKSSESTVNETPDGGAEKESEQAPIQKKTVVLKGQKKKVPAKPKTQARNSARTSTSDSPEDKAVKINENEVKNSQQPSPEKATVKAAAKPDPVNEKPVSESKSVEPSSAAPEIKHGKAVSKAGKNKEDLLLETLDKAYDTVSDDEDSNFMDDEKVIDGCDMISDEEDDEFSSQDSLSHKVEVRQVSDKKKATGARGPVAKKSTTKPSRHLSRSSQFIRQSKKGDELKILDRKQRGRGSSSGRSSHSSESSKRRSRESGDRTNKRYKADVKQTSPSSKKQEFRSAREKDRGQLRQSSMEKQRENSRNKERLVAQKQKESASKSEARDDEKTKTNAVGKPLKKQVGVPGSGPTTQKQSTEAIVDASFLDEELDEVDDEMLQDLLQTGEWEITDEIIEMDADGSGSAVVEGGESMSVKKFVRNTTGGKPATKGKVQGEDKAKDEIADSSDPESRPRGELQRLGKDDILIAVEGFETIEIDSENEEKEEAGSLKEVDCISLADALDGSNIDISFSDSEVFTEMAEVLEAAGSELLGDSQDNACQGKEHVQNPVINIERLDMSLVSSWIKDEKVLNDIKNELRFDSSDKQQLEKQKAAAAAAADAGEESKKMVHPGNIKFSKKFDALSKKLSDESRLAKPQNKNLKLKMVCRNKDDKITVIRRTNKVDGKKAPNEAQKSAGSIKAEAVNLKHNSKDLPKNFQNYKIPKISQKKAESKELEKDARGPKKIGKDDQKSHVSSSPEDYSLKEKAKLLERKLRKIKEQLAKKEREPKEKTSSSGFPARVVKRKEFDRFNKDSYPKRFKREPSRERNYSSDKSESRSVKVSPMSKLKDKKEKYDDKKRKKEPEPKRYTIPLHVNPVSKRSTSRYSEKKCFRNRSPLNTFKEMDIQNTNANPKDVRENFPVADVPNPNFNQQFENNWAWQNNNNNANPPANVHAAQLNTNQAYFNAPPQVPFAGQQQPWPNVTTTPYVYNQNQNYNQGNADFNPQWNKPYNEHANAVPPPNTDYWYQENAGAAPVNCENYNYSEPQRCGNEWPVAMNENANQGMSTVGVEQNFYNRPNVAEDYRAPVPSGNSSFPAANMEPYQKSNRGMLPEASSRPSNLDCLRNSIMDKLSNLDSDVLTRVESSVEHMFASNASFSPNIPSKIETVSSRRRDTVVRNKEVPTFLKEIPLHRPSEAHSIFDKKARDFESIDGKLKAQIAEQLAAVLTVTGNTELSETVLARLVQQAIDSKRKEMAYSNYKNSGEKKESKHCEAAAGRGSSKTDNIGRQIPVMTNYRAEQATNEKPFRSKSSTYCPDKRKSNFIRTVTECKSHISSNFCPIPIDEGGSKFSKDVELYGRRSELPSQKKIESSPSKFSSPDTAYERRAKNKIFSREFDRPYSHDSKSNLFERRDNDNFARSFEDHISRPASLEEISNSPSGDEADRYGSYYRAPFKETRSVTMRNFRDSGGFRDDFMPHSLPGNSSLDIPFRKEDFSNYLAAQARNMYR